MTKIIVNCVAVFLLLVRFYVGNGWVAGGCWDDEITSDDWDHSRKFPTFSISKMKSSCEVYGFQMFSGCILICFTDKWLCCRTTKPPQANPFGHHSQTNIALCIGTGAASIGNW